MKAIVCFGNESEIKAIFDRIDRSERNRSDMLVRGSDQVQAYITQNKPLWAEQRNQCD